MRLNHFIVHGNEDLNVSFAIQDVIPENNGRMYPFQCVSTILLSVLRKKMQSSKWNVDELLATLKAQWVNDAHLFPNLSTTIDTVICAYPTELFHCHYCRCRIVFFVQSLSNKLPLSLPLQMLQLLLLI